MTEPSAQERAEELADEMLCMGSPLRENMVKKLLVYRADVVAQAVQAERERICKEAELWANLSSSLLKTEMFLGFALAIRDGKGPFNNEALNEHLRHSSALRARPTEQVKGQYHGCDCGEPNGHAKDCSIWERRPTR